MAADTGASDEIYNVVSVLYHALQGAETYDKYVQDARAHGHEGLVEFFESAKREDAARARRAQEILHQLYTEHGGPS